ncbi:hypothetical protein M408DRAFT_140108 [Serendipita vermifera MAFF 305830]|uniref:Uncharacterized protein n=1 Tax=Serendipita vermifera MAFF 305830 TaxID=933852 RepID=A0A0C3BA48_SERVB|nr:hypothetical protein M408DRAFT_140108 [Serendipita vermifera MAFF 305830]
MAAVARYTRRVWKSFLDNGGHETVVCRPLKLENITRGKITASLTIAEHNLNRGKFMAESYSPSQTRSVHSQ